MREDPLPDNDPNEKFYGGDNQYRITGQAKDFKQLNIHALEAFDKGQDIHLQAAPSQAELLYREFKIKKEKLKAQVKDDIMRKYGNAASEEKLPMKLLMGQSERQVEYDRTGRVIKGQEKDVPKSKYEEDVYINNHAAVWGSWWKDHLWGYRCCQQTIKNSYCTGLSGIEATEATNDLMKANLTFKDVARANPVQHEEKNLVNWGTDIPSDVVLDKKRLTEDLRKVDEGKREEKDERKRKYNVSWNDEVTAEDMEAYRLKRVHHDDPMKDFLH